MSELATYAPAQPSLDRGGLVLWSGYRSKILLARLIRHAVGIIAKPLVHAHAESETITCALDLGLGVALPGEAWRNQLPPGARKRAGAFEHMRYAVPDQLDVTANHDDEWVAEYAHLFLDEQIARGATVVMSPAHVQNVEGGAGRELDMRLADASVRQFADRQATRPAPGRSQQRSLYASLLVQGAHLERSWADVVEAYAALEVDGYWLTVVNCSQSAAQLGAATRLVLGLQHRTGRPCVVSGVGAAHLALLAVGAAATCIGHHGATLTFPPPEWSAPAPGQQAPGIGVHTHHRAILASLGIGARFDPERRELFRRWPCNCGAHARDVPPATSAERIAHNLYVTMTDAASIVTRPPGEREDYMAMRIARAADARTELGISRLRAGWRAVARAARDAADHEATGLKAS
jgi:hypothetical protein